MSSQPEVEYRHSVVFLGSFSVGAFHYRNGFASDLFSEEEKDAIDKMHRIETPSYLEYRTSSLKVSCSSGRLILATLADKRHDELKDRLFMLLMNAPQMLVTAFGYNVDMTLSFLDKNSWMELGYSLVPKRTFFEELSNAQPELSNLAVLISHSEESSRLMLHIAIDPLAHGNGKWRAAFRLNDHFDKDVIDRIAYGDDASTSEPANEVYAQLDTVEKAVEKSWDNSKCFNIEWLEKMIEGVINNG